MARLNLASGEFILLEVPVEQIQATLERIRPAEILHPESWTPDFGTKRRAPASQTGISNSIQPAACSASSSRRLARRLRCRRTETRHRPRPAPCCSTRRPRSRASCRICVA
jgi:DNA mismatch repair ATPase MutS